MRYTEIVESAINQTPELDEAKAPVSPKLLLLKKLAAACEAAPSTVRNTTEEYGSLRYVARLKDGRASKAKSFMQSLGFQPENAPSTGGSSHGDFSSDRYGITWKHASGVECYAGAWFGGGESPTFSISVSGDDAAISEILSPQQ